MFLGLAGCLFTDSPPLALPQVTFRPDLSTAEVHDEHIKGPLKVGLRRHGGAERGCTGGWHGPVLCSMLDEHPVFAPQVGAVVEVKNPDGVYQEATINKLTDASIYTVGESATSPLEVFTDLVIIESGGEKVHSSNSAIPRDKCAVMEQLLCYELIKTCALLIYPGAE